MVAFNVTVLGVSVVIFFPNKLALVCPNTGVVMSGSKMTKSHCQGFKMTVHNALGDDTEALSTSFKQAIKALTGTDALLLRYTYPNVTTAV